jgi:hypothetical protein
LNLKLGRDQAVASTGKCSISDQLRHSWRTPKKRTAMGAVQHSGPEPSIPSRIAMARPGAARKARQRDPAGRGSSAYSDGCFVDLPIMNRPTRGAGRLALIHHPIE